MNEDPEKRAGWKPGGRPQVVGVVSEAATLAGLVEGSCSSGGADMIELRVDLLSMPDDRLLEAAGVLRSRGLPFLMTLRDEAEGGRWQGTPQDKLQRLQNLATGMDVVDIELRNPIAGEVVRWARSRGIAAIGSAHDFERLPPDADLQAWLELGRTLGVDLVKVAARLHSAADEDRMVDMLRTHRDAPVCFLGMGPLGLSSRIRLVHEGSRLTYGYLGRANAPGQPSCAELVQALAGNRSG